MSRVSRARQVATAAALGGGGLTFVGALGVAVVAVEARLARRWIGQPFGLAGPEADGVYGHGPGEPIQLAVLGDSTADGLGATEAAETPGAIVASGLAAVSGRPVHLTNVAVVGAESTDLADQVAELLGRVSHPDVAVILIGGNDVTHRIKVPVAVGALAAAVTSLREVGCEVVVGTCPDLGSIEPIAQPLRSIARRWSRELAAAQTVAVVEAGGRTVSLGDILGPEFAASPRELFSADRFHPSPAGYARCAAALLPSVCAAAGYWPDGGRERHPDIRRGEGVAPVAEAAVAAAEDPGTEVSGANVAGADRGPLGRWATLLRRRRQPLPAQRSFDPDARDDERPENAMVTGE
ncbi:MAG: SGNH/GDSL hydrolase family protein [Actinomycetes bacterium]